MYRLVFTSLGILECLVAMVLIYLGQQLPRPTDVRSGFAQTRQVTQNAQTQIRILRHQVQDLRRPELQQLTARLGDQSRVVSATLQDQQIDFETVAAIRDAMGNVAAGLEGTAETLDPERVEKLGKGLTETATFLEKTLIPNADKAAQHIEDATRLLREDAQRLQVLIEELPLDLKSAQEVHDGLVKFEEGLTRMNAMLQRQQVGVFRDGFTGMAESLTTGAEQVERLAGYTYPNVTFDGFRPNVEQRPFWPEGKTIAGGMRRAAESVRVASKEMEQLSKDMPKLQTALQDSQKVVSQTRAALALALQQQDKLEPLLKGMPRRAALLAEELPKVGADLAAILREARRFQEVAAALRQAQESLQKTVASWPELSRTLRNSATLLRTTQRQLDRVVTNRAQYEAARNQTAVLADTFAAMLPMLTDQLDNRLDEEEQALHELESSLQEVNRALPVYERSTLQVFQASRWLVWLMTAIVALHGCYMIASVWTGENRQKAKE
ncbi:MAG: hypothetical protein ACK4RK_09325 [Gemmataceae bacterium]